MTTSFRLWLVKNGVLNINENIIPVSVQDYMMYFEKGYIKQDLSTAESVHDFIDILNDIFNNRQIYFKYIVKIGDMGGITHNNGKIEIFISDNHQQLFKDDFLEFYDEISDIFKHELIHREQFKRVNLNKYKQATTDDVNLTNIQKNQKYLSNKLEMMSFSRNIVDELIREFKTKNKVLDFLRHPILGKSDVLDSYIIHFRKNKKILNDMYKYMYQYIINDFDKKEIK